MTSDLRVGIVGCGEITQTVHLPLLTEMEGFIVTAICDVSDKVRRELSKRYSINSTYANFNDLVAQKDVDVVLVANRDHAPVAIAAMDAGKHVLVEKPMAYNLEEANEMVLAAEKNHVKLMVGLMKRYDPAFEFVMEQIKQIKNPQLIRVHNFAGEFAINHEIFDQVYGDDLDKSLRQDTLLHEEHQMKIALGSSHVAYIDAYSNLLYLIIHDLIILNSTFGLPDEVLFTEVFNNDSIVSVLKYGNGTRCVIEGGLILKRRTWDEHFMVYGDDKRIEINFPYPYIRNMPTEIVINEQDGKANVEKKIVVSLDEAFKKEWQHLRNCILNDVEPITSGAKCLQELELCKWIIQAAKPNYLSV